MNETSRQGSEAVPEEDYRRSHLARGCTYDAALAAAPFDAYMAGLESVFLREIVPALFPHERPRYLDFACGTGRITATVAPLCDESVAVDVSDSMLEQARAKCSNVHFVRADLTDGGTSLGRFGLVTAFRFFGNAQDALREAALAALHPLLQPGGYLILNSHRNPHSIASLLQSRTGGTERTDLHFFKLRSLLRRHGFELHRIRPIGVWMYRGRLLASQHDPERASRLERLFRAPIFAPIAPDVVVVARKVGSTPPVA